MRVIITFKTSKLEKIFNKERMLVREYGDKNAKRIRVRMAVLLAAQTLACVPTSKPDRCHQLTASRQGQFAVDLEHPFRLAFRPNHDPIPRRGDGGIDLSKVTAIEILDVGDYH